MIRRLRINLYLRSRRKRPSPLAKALTFCDVSGSLRRVL